MDENGVLSAVVDMDERRLRTVAAGLTLHLNLIPDDENGVWGKVYDQASQSLRVVVVNP